MKIFFANAYRYLLTIPDRLYPFKSEIEGRWVRGQQSYEAAVKRALAQYGLGRLGYKLMLYRETFHFIGSILFMVFATLVARELFGSDAAIYVLLVLAVLALSFQEFYVHPRTFGQHARKGVMDWLVWVGPMAIYALLLAR